MQAELPSSQSSKIIQPLRALKSRQNSMQLGQGPSDGGPGASPRLCALLNDLRELRTKQGELTNALKACVPPVWWGVDAGYKSQLGDRFKMCQVRTCCAELAPPLSCMPPEAHADSVVAASSSSAFATLCPPAPKHTTFCRGFRWPISSVATSWTRLPASRFYGPCIVYCLSCLVIHLVAYSPSCIPSQHPLSAGGHRALVCPGSTKPSVTALSQPVSYCVHGKSCLQVDIERSYALVLHKLVKRINGKLTHLLRQALDEQLTQDSNCQLASPGAAYSCTPLQPVARLQPLTNMYQFQLAQMASHLDVRVYRRVARELWNAAAGVGLLTHVHCIGLMPAHSVCRVHAPCLQTVCVLHAPCLNTLLPDPAA